MVHVILCPKWLFIDLVYVLAVVLNVAPIPNWFRNHLPFV